VKHIPFVDFFGKLAQIKIRDLRTLKKRTTNVLRSFSAFKKFIRIGHPLTTNQISAYRRERHFPLLFTSKTKKQKPTSNPQENSKNRERNRLQQKNRKLATRDSQD